MNNLGKNIRYLRKERKMSQEKLGDMLNKSVSSIQMWETGFRSPTMGCVQKISEIFDVSINDLVNRDLQDLGEEDDHATLSTREAQLIRKYRMIDAGGRYVIDTLVDDLLERCIREREKPHGFEV